MILSRAPELAPSFALNSTSSLFLNPNQTLTFSLMPSSSFSTLSLLRSLSLRRLYYLRSLSSQRLPAKTHQPFSPKLWASSPSSSSSSLGTLAAQRNTDFVEHVADRARFSGEECEERWDGSRWGEESKGVFDFLEVDSARNDARHVAASEEANFQVKELEELPEQWRRSRLAWLCKELPSHKAGTLVRILNAQKKWLRQEDATYVIVHCIRIRENEAGFRVYRWMTQQQWYRFDFGLATKLADCLGKQRKFAKCREIFDDILNQGRVPSESTFHILVVAYLSAPVQGCLEEACSIYNRMIQLGGYMPRLSLHNSLFKALVSKPGGTSKHYLKQAEYIFHNLVTTHLEIQSDIYGGLIWLHSYQDTIDSDRIAFLRQEMHHAGFPEGKGILVSVLRACSKDGNVEEAESTWLKLQGSDNAIPPQAFVYKMEVYSKAGDFMRSFEIFREMEKCLGSANVAAYHKIIEILCKAQEVELAERLMKEFIESGQKPLMPSYIDMLTMYLSLGLHDKLELKFMECTEKCQMNQTIYNVYLDSLVKVGSLEKAERVFKEMFSNERIGVNSRTCNTILRGYIALGNYVKAEKVYDTMCQKKYDVEAPLMEKLEYVLSLVRRKVKKPISLKLSKEQREILVGLLLGGLRIESDEDRKNHMIRFEFRENFMTHSILRQHIHREYHEWLHPSSKLSSNDSNDIPYRFATVSHSYFGFYADQFWPKGRFEIPKLIHRWLSPRTLAHWFMYGGHRTSLGDILLKVKGGKVDGVEKVVKALRAKSLNCRVKRKGRVFWIGLLGHDSIWFWKLIEPYVLDDLKDHLNPTNERGEDARSVNFDSGMDSEQTDDDSSC